MSDHDDLDPVTAFEDGWPDLHPLGLIVTRSTVTLPRTPSDDDGGEGDRAEPVQWILHLGVAEATPKLAILGDLTVTTDTAFAGVTVAMPFALRDEPTRLTVKVKDSLLRQYGPWASTVIYDHAATVLRTALAGQGFMSIVVPFATPTPRLHTSDFHRKK